MTTHMELPVALVTVLEFAYNETGAPLNQHPGCWTRDFGGGWFVALNGHPEPQTYAMPDGVTHTCAPFTLHAHRHGWPAMILDPAGGLVAGVADEEPDLQRELLDVVLAAREGR